MMVYKYNGLVPIILNIFKKKKNGKNNLAENSVILRIILPKKANIRIRTNISPVANLVKTS